MPPKKLGRPFATPANPKKKVRYLGMKIEASVWDILNSHCKSSGHSKTWIVEAALAEYLKNK